MVNKKDTNQEIMDETAEKVIKPFIDQLDRIEAEVNFIKDDIRELKIMISKN